MADDRSFRNWAGRGLAAAAICAGLSLSPLPALAEEAASAQPDAPVAATTEAAPAAVTEAAPVPAAEPAPVATAQASATPAEELKSAQSAQATAQDAVTNAQNDVSQKTALKNAADDAVKSAEQDIRDAANAGTVPSDEELAQKKQTSDDAQAQADQAAKDTKAAQQQVSSAQADKNAKDAAVTSAKSALDKANAAATSAQRASDANPVSDAQAKVDAAQKTYDQAVADAGNPKSSTQFLDSETNGAYSQGYKDINAAGKYKVDGTGSTYEDLLNACDMMDEVNRIRRSRGLTELKVDPYLVFIEVLEADINDVGSQMGHSDWQRSHSYTGANLAWGYTPKGAVDNGWMGEEVEFKDYIKTHKTATLWGKTIDITKIGTASADPNAGYALYASDPAEYMEVGHFINLVSTDTTAQGAGFVTNSNVAAWIGGNGGRDSTYDVPQTFYTVSEWRAKVQAAKYTYENAGNAVKSAKRALDAAKANLATAQSLAKKAQDAKTAASNAQTKYDQAVSAASAAATRVTNAKTALSNAQAKQSKADSTAKSARAEYERALTAHDAAAKASAAQANLPTLGLQASDAANALKAAQTRLASAQSDLKAANARLSAAHDAWKRATATVELYRLFDPHSGEHLYTSHMEEVTHLVGQGWDWERAQTMLVPKVGVPVYRLFNPTNGDHHYTTDTWEAKVLTTQKGWLYDFNGGAAFYGAKSGRPVYRINDPHASRFGHLFTADANERNVHLREGWEDEKIAWYAVDPATTKAPTAPKPTATRKAFYAIRFDGNGGSGTMSAQATQASTPLRLRANAFARSGYTFAGWSRTATGAVAYGDQATVRNLSGTDGDAVALYAVWDPINMTYAVRYDGNGATSGSTASQTMMRDQYASLATNGYSKTGYTFSKWSTAKTGSGTQYSQGQSVTNLAPAGSTATLYARWNPNTYSVCYMPSGSEGELSVQSFTYDQEGYLRSTEFSRTGYRCAGWATYEGGSKAYELGQRVKNLTANPNGCIYLYPAWEPITYYVQFQGNGYTSGSMSREQFTYDQYKNLTSNAYSRTGYKFTGWKDSSASSSYTDGQRVGNLSDTENDTIYLYAQWTPITYYVQFNGNGYTSGSMNSQAFTYDKGQSLTSNSYSRTGYTFAGWKDTDHGKSYSNGQYVSNLSSVENGSVTLNAQWAPISYTVRFNNNGGMNEMASVSMTYDQSTTLKKSPFVREGYSFAGWATSASGSARYSDGASVGNLTSTNGGTVTLYAVWTKRPDGRLIEDGTYLIHSYDPAHVDVAVGVDAKDNGTAVKLQAWYALDNDNAGTASEAAKKQSWTFEWDSKLGGYKITNDWSGRVLEIKNEGDSLNQDGTLAQIWDDDGTSLCKRWYLRRNSNGLQLINCASLRALDMRQEDGYVAGARVEQWAAEIENPQQTYELTLLSVPAGTTKIQNFETGTYVIELSADSSKCLELPADNLGDGAPVQAGTYTGASNQKWEITKNDDGTYKITNVASKAAGNLESFDNTGWALKSGTKLEVWESSGNQRPVKWIIQKNSDGTYSFTSTFSRLAVSLPQEGGTQLELRPISTGTNVRFKLVKC